MAQIDCVIDTQPMADEISSVSNHINGTTAAVVGMKAAVVQAESEAADHVCQNVNKGFYTLIHSQISQKIAKLRSEVDSHTMRLSQLQRQLLGIKGRMERDYGMISQRYLKLFGALNKNLQQRVFELDKPVIEFAVKDVNTIFNRTKQMPATVPVSQQESLSVSQRILISNVKYQGKRVIDSMRWFLADTKEQKELTEQVLLPVRPEENADIMVPVLLSECNYDGSGNKRMDVIVTHSGLTQRSQDAIRNSISAAALNLQWEEGVVADEVKSAFSRFLSVSSASQRVKDMANKLFMANGFQVLKK